MPLFVIIGYDVANSQDARKQARPAHLERLNALQKAGRLIIAGSTPVLHGETTMSGSIVIADFDDIGAAKHWADDEPYLTEGIYSHIELRPFVQVLPK